MTESGFTERCQLDDTDRVLLALVAHGGVEFREDAQSAQPVPAPTKSGWFAGWAVQRLSRLLVLGHIARSTVPNSDHDELGPGSARLTKVGAAALRR